jgi:GNAT superfamily N-acetyltransferase
MDAVIRPLRDTDRPAVARLLDDAVGAGFWRFAEGADATSFVAVYGAGEVAGAALTCLEPADDPDARTALSGSSAAGAEAGELVLHVRELAVAPAARRTGIASRLMARAEAEALARGATAAYAFGWLPAGRPEPDAVPFYVAAGYEARPDIPDFYAEGSVATGALCPYCGEPPCRCAVRSFVKALEPR